MVRNEDSAAAIVDVDFMETGNVKDDKILMPRDRNDACSAVVAQLYP